MAEWMVDTGLLRGVGVSGIEGCARTVRSIREAVNAEACSLKIQGYQAYGLKAKLQQICGELEGEAAALQRVARATESAARQYEKTEGQVAGKEFSGRYSEKAKDGFLAGISGALAGVSADAAGEIVANGNEYTHGITDYEIDSMITNGKNSYGGNQGSPVSKTTEKWFLWHDVDGELAKVVRKYHKDWSDEEIYDYLKLANKHGCGYVGLTNALFPVLAELYAGKEKEFEADFGFSLYGADGDLNYDALFMDIFSATDEELDGGVGGWLNGLTQGELIDWKLWKNTQAGTDPDRRKEILEKYLNEVVNKKSTVRHFTENGIKVEYEMYCDVTPENFRSEYAEQGKQVIMTHSNGEVYDGAGAAYSTGKGHAMLVTGTTDQDEFTVSSWGKKCYVETYKLDGKHCRIRPEDIKYNTEGEPYPDDKAVFYNFESVKLTYDMAETTEGGNG